MKNATLIAAAGALLTGSVAFAQPSGPPTAPTTGESTASSADFSDAQVQGFAEAVMEMQGVAQDSSLDQTQRQEAMVAIIQESDLNAQTFNAIGQAARTDSDLQERIQMAAADMQGGAQAQ